MDNTDARILSALSSDSRRSYAEVGAEVGLSTAAVHERVRKLIERGVIEHFDLRIAPEKVGLHFTAFVAIRNESGINCAHLAEQLRAIPQVLELHSVAGEYDELLKVRTRNATEFEQVIYQIKAIPGIARTTSTVVLRSEFENRTPVLLPAKPA
jgi:Lrp/AsnC family transcriptional regulator, leucine-responsive regulatory protein